ncbi:hypothetical protein M9Y10_032713 [Tritrichomonas musculus]|uniref:Uncharacterized protein n=1 Tax=Tritrichomonas musculus TaxID=1915356 RepID=A0ABR2GXS6_9EUKA
MWSLIYKKGIKWLKSNYSKINWERLIHQIMTDKNEEEEEKQFIQFKENKLIFLLNFNDKSASVIGNDSANGDVIIPKSINYNNHEYNIKSTASNAFKGSKDIISIHFHHDSEIQSIDKDAFVESSIKSIAIPESVFDLKEGWCHGIPKLINVHLAPANKISFILIIK